ncbi:phage replisome organizer N-terminal domain-containing protein [uncultured Megasphaera sp.]|jgi:predicted phage replisome organizer|uniref:phage replisome organizer N-terminal domain-containing protein n=1 Tax=uncultured Megasphaera sp. TaxID=165188 RepID=UPI0025FF4E93|nr:phage replisome organizer N-terminal domain-containing protein [uncultured Megasphaera sp.]
MKKLQWLKTKVGLFSDPRILYLMNQPNGDSYIVLWFFLKDMAGTVNDDGRVYVSEKEAMTTQLIAKCLHRRRPFIERGLEVLEQVNLIERDENGVIRIKIWDDLQDFQKNERCREQTKERVRRYRERQRQAEPADCPVSETPVVEEKSVESETVPEAETPVFEGEAVTTPKTMKDYASVQKYESLFGPMQGNFAKQLIELEKLWGSEATCTAIEIAHDNNVNNIPYIRAVLANSNGRPMRKEDAYERKQRECYEHIDAVLREARREKLQRLQAENAGRNAARNDDGDAGPVSFASLVKTM